MTLAIGTIEYNLGTPPVTGQGLSWSTDELEAALAGPVGEVVFDVTGKADLAGLLSGLSDTEFDQTAVCAILEETTPPENWRVGEAVAESYLAHHCGCHFPWPDGRDERKAGSSLPGADLVGFQNEGDTERFAFGEVKTSSENSYPPGAMHGQTGLKQQLEDLRDKKSLRDGLVKYLGHRASFAPWKDRYQRAAVRYLRDSGDVRIFGVMIRDVAPNQDDLRVRVNKLATNCPANMLLKLIAVYFPDGSISTLSEKVSALRKGGDA